MRRRQTQILPHKSSLRAGNVNGWNSWQFPEIRSLMLRCHHRTCDILLITQVVEGWGKDRWRQREAKVPFQQESVPAIMALIHLFYTEDLITSPWVLLPRGLNFQRMLLERTHSRTNNQETIRWQNVRRKEGFLLIKHKKVLFNFIWKTYHSIKKSQKKGDRIASPPFG